MRQSSQVGSIIMYIGIAVVLAGLLVGGVYFIRQQTAQKPSSAEIGAQKPTTSQEVDASKQADEKKADEEAAKDASSEAAQAEEQAIHQSASEGASQAVTATELPQTGSSEMMSIVLAAGMLTAAGVAYIQSRRQVVAF